MKMELRVQDTELRVDIDGTMTVSGYVNKTNEFSNILGATKKFVEKITKGAFAKAILNSTRDIDFLAEHQGKLILASTRNQSLVLTEDEEGLFMSATITPTSWGKDYYELINSGILRNMSFGFRTVKDSWKSIGSGLFERTIEELELFEVSVVRDPAYSQSTIAARGTDLVEEVEIPFELEEEQRQMEQLKLIVKELEERVNSLTAEVKELRSVEVVEEQLTEVPVIEEKEVEKPVVEAEIPAEIEPEVVVQEEEIPAETPVVEEVIEELPAEKSEDSETLVAEIKEDEPVVVDEASRSITEGLAELRKRLTQLKS